MCLLFFFEVLQCSLAPMPPHHYYYFMQLENFEFISPGVKHVAMLL